MSGISQQIKSVFWIGVIGIGIGALGARLADALGWIKFFDNVHWTFGSTAAAVLAWLGVRHHPQTHDTSLWWFAMGLTGYAIGQVVWDIQDLIGYSQFPSPSDLFYLWLGPCIAYGFISLCFSRIVGGERKLAILDCTMLITAAVALVLVLYLPKRGDTDFFLMTVMIAYPSTLLGALSIGLIMIPILRLNITPALLFFLVGIALMTWSWMVWNSMALDGLNAYGSWFNPSFSASLMLMGSAIPFLKFDRNDNASWNRYCEACLRLLPLAAVILACFAVIAAQMLERLPPLVIEITRTGSIIVIMLAVVRQYALLNEHDKFLMAESSLKQERLLSNAIIEGLPGVFLLLDEHGTILKHNSQFKQFLNQATPEPSDRPHFYNAVPEVEKPLVNHLFQQVLEQGDVSFEMNLIAAQDNLVTHGFSFSRIVFDNIVYLMGIGIDISAQKQAMGALEDSRNFLQQVLETIPLRIFWKDRNSRYLGCNRAFANDAGLPGTADILGKTDDQLAWRSEAHLYKADDEQVMSTLAPKLAFDEQIVNSEGDRIWIRTSKVALRNARQELLGVLGVYEDIAERKRLEESLKLASLVFEHSREVIIVTNENNEAIAVNPSFTRVTGYERDEIIGKNPNMLASEKHDAEFYENMWQSIRQQGHWEGEIWDKRKSGEIYPQRFSISVIRHPDGTIFRHVGIGADITDKKQAEEIIWQQANFDALTQLPNRRMLADRMAHELKKAKRGKYPLSVLFIDLDHFKDVNDSLGHQMGDLLLIEAAQRMRLCIRETDTLARLGGDEFAIIILHAKPVDLDRIANTIILDLNAPFQLDHEQAYISGSIGIACYPDDGYSTEELLKKADQAMYAAKQAGRSRVNYFKADMQDAALLHMRLATDMRSALTDNNFDLYFQPIVDLASGGVFKAEALLRWKHPLFGYISPERFIPIAENTGFIHELGNWVFTETLLWSRRWSEAIGRSFINSVNLSPIQLMRKTGIETWLGQFLEAGLEMDGLVLEITEGMLLNDNPEVAAKLLSLRKHGMQISIDDFGTGYSSLSYLNKFPINYLKIDKSFINSIHENATQRALVEAIIVMAHKLNLKVIAEGVELEAQRQLLLAAGCDYGQGYLFSKPIPAKAFEALYIGPLTTLETASADDAS